MCLQDILLTIVQHAIGINLSHNGLSGSIPPGLGSLSNLESLSLDHSQLIGNIPASLGNLTHLDTLWLNNTNLDGALPQSLKNVPNLFEFVFHDTNLCEPLDAAFQAWLSRIPVLWGTGVPCAICDSVTEIPKLECEALAALYNGNNGRMWPGEPGWLTTCTPCSTPWYGVKCNDGHVTELALVYNGLFYALPSQLGNLTNLQKLDLSVNNLSGSIPPELGNLSNLTTLDLSYNKLTGSIPTTLGNLGKLQELDLESNGLSGSIPPELGNLANLTKLSLLGNHYLSGGIPLQLGNLGELQELYLGSNALGGSIPPELGNLSNLTRLNLHFDQLSGSIPPQLGNLRNLQMLDLQYNELSGGIPAELGSLANLVYLNLSGNQLSGIPPELGNLHNLLYLYLSSNPFNASIPPELGNLYNLLNLELDRCQLTGSIPPQLGSLHRLAELSLQDNLLTGSIPPELGNMANLKELALLSNTLTGNIPPQLGNLSKLTVLFLQFNQLSGSIPDELGNPPNLFYLILSHNQLTGGVPSSLGNLRYIWTLALDNNPLSGPLPSSLMNTSPVGFWFDETNLCEPPDMQYWLSFIPSLRRTNILCSDATPTQTPTPTNTPTRTRTRAPTATPTPTPTAITFDDEFTGPMLASRWSWVREDASHWSLTARPGFLRITSQKGGIFYATNNARNLLLQLAPAGDFSIETRVLFTPTQDYQMAGLVIYQDDDNFLILSRDYCDVAHPTCVGNGIYYDLEEGGTNAGSDFIAAPASPNETYLRLARQGNVYTAYYSENGADWRLLGQQTPSAGFRPTFVGLTANDNDLGAAEISADFDYVRFGAVSFATPTPTVTRTSTASRTPTVTRTPTETLTPTSTFTPRPTNTPGPSPTWVPGAAPRMYLPILMKTHCGPCSDEFSGPGLAPCWSWVNEDPADWSLTAQPGFLRIFTDSGGVGSKNLAIQRTPSGDFDVRTRVLFAPTSNYQIAGVALYQDSANYLMLGRAYCDNAPPECVGNGIYFDDVESGTLVGVNFAMPTAKMDEAYLRIVRQGNTYTGYYSEDGLSWTLVGSHTPAAGIVLSRVGLTATQDLADLRILADFDYFRFSAVE